MADDPSAMIDREGAPLMDIHDWCMSLNQKTVDKVAQAGCTAACSAIGYVDPQTNEFKVYVLAAGVADDLTVALVDRVAHAVNAYKIVGDPRNHAPPKSEVN